MFTNLYTPLPEVHENHIHIAYRNENPPAAKTRQRRIAILLEQFKRSN